MKTKETGACCGPKHSAICVSVTLWPYVPEVLIVIGIHGLGSTPAWVSPLLMHPTPGVALTCLRKGYPERRKSVQTIHQTGKL